MKRLRVAAPLLVVLVAAVAGGCSLFEPEEAPPGSTPVIVQSDTPPDITEEQRQSDVDSCREQAQAVVDQEQNITSDIDSRDAQGAFWDDSADLTRNMNEFESRKRYNRILEECMRARGYGKETEEPQ